MDFDQVGAIPYRERKGQIEVLLITTRSRGRWIVPKGNVETELGPRRSAVLEAYEEGGVKGTLHRPVLGTYWHGDPPDCRIRIYLLSVEETHSDWPEVQERQRQWKSVPEARQTVDEDGLRPLLDAALHLIRDRQPSNQ